MIIFKLQKKLIRIISFKCIDSPCRPLFKTLNILPVPCVYIYVCLSFMWSDIKSTTTNKNLHSYDTRISNKIHVEYLRTRCAALGPKPMSIKLFNALPAELRNIQNISLFRNRLRSFLMVNMFYSVQEFFL